MYWERVDDPTLFVSVDMESDGPVPYRNNFLSVGAVAYATDVYVVNRRWGIKCRALRRFPDFFSQNIRAQKGAMPDEATMENFWHKDEHHMSLYQATQINQIPVEQAMRNLTEWLMIAKNWASQGYYGQVDIIPVARPGPFDFHWFSAGYEMSGMENPFGNKGLDMQSYLLGVRRKVHFGDVKASTWKDSWSNPCYPHTHIAVEDAAAQGEVFRNMYEEALNRGPRSMLALQKLREQRRLGFID
ncbi:MAG: hypothetical protein OSB62_04485 [Alphaproteobacteria bacterium]|nr:hypothetical protein [Alphaproteobacteria bacterium]